MKRKYKNVSVRVKRPTNSISNSNPNSNINSCVIGDNTNCCNALKSNGRVYWDFDPNSTMYKDGVEYTRIIAKQDFYTSGNKFIAKGTLGGFISNSVKLADDASWISAGVMLDGDVTVQGSSCIISRNSSPDKSLIVEGKLIVDNMGCITIDEHSCLTIWKNCLLRVLGGLTLENKCCVTIQKHSIICKFNHLHLMEESAFSGAIDLKADLIIKSHSSVSGDFIINHNFEIKNSMIVDCGFVINDRLTIDNSALSESKFLINAECDIIQCNCKTSSIVVNKPVIFRICEIQDNLIINANSTFHNCLLCDVVIKTNYEFVSRVIKNQFI